MLEKIELKYGDVTTQERLPITLTPITIFVGPNNSGKSLILREIESFCTSYQKEFFIINNAEIKRYSREEIDAEISDSLTKVNHGLHQIAKINSYGKFSKITIHKEHFYEHARSFSIENNQFKNYIALHTLRLDGTSRLDLLKKSGINNLLEKPQSRLGFLFVNDEVRKKLRETVFNAIGQYFYIDPTEGGMLNVRLSAKPEPFLNVEKSLTNEALDFYKAATSIEEMSDGVRAFCGIISSLVAGEPRIILIDEPEAFLHPALAHRLGCDVGSLLRGSEKRFFASTHSPDFLMGCIQSKQAINIVRLTYKNGVSTARILDSGQIFELMRNPLLRSTGVLNALFFENVVVCEADSDRAFYQEINERLLEKEDQRGIRNCLFINAQNKQTVWDIVRPLRRLGIPSTGIVDIDVLKEGGTVFKKLTDGIHFPSPQCSSIENQRAAIYKSFKRLDEEGKMMKRKGGIKLLSGEEAEACRNFFEQLSQYGAFVVSGGELESWLKDKNIPESTHGPSWLLSMFSAMGDDPDSPEYATPASGDVWDFIGEIKAWLENPLRKGIPSA